MVHAIIIMRRPTSSSNRRLCSTRGPQHTDITSRQQVGVWTDEDLEEHYEFRGWFTTTVSLKTGQNHAQT